MPAQGDAPRRACDIVGRWIRSWLPAMQPLHQVATVAEFATWCEVNPGWLEDLRLSMLNPDGFAKELDSLTASVRNHLAR